ncbi:hypothetical protein EV424DRAFT_1345238 [Suillus variegatus]|nr:hypothetical protein EV424DRAFT_1345238 [Suillus variegatus]
MSEGGALPLVFTYALVLTREDVGDKPLESYHPMMLIYKQGVLTKVFILDNLGALKSHGHSSSDGLVARLAHTTTDKLIVRLAGYGIKKHMRGESLSRTNSLSLQPVNVLEGMNILLRGALGTGKKMVAHAICNMLKRSTLDIWANDIPYLADVQPWAAQPVANVGYNFSVKMIWFSAISSRKHAPVPTVRDTKTWAFERLRTSLGYRRFHEYGTNIGWEQDSTPQRIKKSLKVWDVPFSVRRKVARFSELCVMPPLEKPSFSRTR